MKTTCDKRNRLWLKPQVTDKRVVGQPGKDHSERSVVKTTGQTPTGFLCARSLLRHWIVVPLASMEVPHHAKFHPVDHIATSLSTGDPEKPVKMTSLSFHQSFLSICTGPAALDRRSLAPSGPAALWHSESLEGIGGPTGTPPCSWTL